MSSISLKTDLRPPSYGVLAVVYRGNRAIVLGRWVVRTLFECLNRFLEIGLGFDRPLDDCIWFVVSWRVQTKGYGSTYLSLGMRKR